MKRFLCSALIVGFSLNSPALAATAEKPADLDAAYKAAGLVKKNGHWTGCPDDENGIAEVRDDGYRDLNKDGSKDLVINDSSSYCYGMTGEGFFLMTRGTGGKWTKLYQSQGIPTFVKTSVKTPGGWPDVEIGGPGFCFPINRWNGKDYVFSRYHEYEKGACRRR